MRGKARIIQPQEGCDYIVLAGLPRDTFETTSKSLKHDRDAWGWNARYEGLPAPGNDWGPLYPRASIEIIVGQLTKFMQRCGKMDVSPADKIPTPRRIVLLFVPSVDADDLLDATSFFACPMPLIPTAGEYSETVGAPSSWRHLRDTARDVVRRTLRDARNVTNALKQEITDGRVSPLALPALNFYYPDDTRPIQERYREFVRGDLSPGSLKSELIPLVFTRDQMDKHVFKDGQFSARFFQDRRQRVFPPDRHGFARFNDSSDSERGPGAEHYTRGKRVDQAGGVDRRDALLALRQRYRFGVIAGDGKLHYDVQYELPRKLEREEMHCARSGPCWVTGSHANVGVNDAVWAPGGRKMPAGDT